MPDKFAQPPANPMMAGLKQAQHIGPGLLEGGEVPLTLAQMPLDPSFTRSLGGLASKVGGMLGIGSKVAPGAIEGLMGAIEGPSSAADMAHPGAQAKMESMYQEANPTFRKLEDSGMFGGDRSVGGIHQIPPRPPAMETLGEVNPEFTPLGGEGLFNSGRGMEDYMKQWQARLK